jgi:hypothetical protein
MLVRSDYTDAIDIQAPSLCCFIIDNTIFDSASDAGSYRMTRLETAVADGNLGVRDVLDETLARAPRANIEAKRTIRPNCTAFPPVNSFMAASAMLKPLAVWSIART